MDDHDVLRHLLDLDARAAALVDDAQAEADRRAIEGEKQNRARYDEVYTREAEALEKSHAKNLASVKEEYRKQLQAYGESLKAMPLDTKAFSTLAEKLLVTGEP